MFLLTSGFEVRRTEQKIDNSLVTMAGLTSASSFISLLSDPEPEVQMHALSKLDKHVDQFWPEIADSIERMFVPSKYCANRT